MTLQRAKGTKGARLSYVTGMVENSSTQQRFGVRLELDLLDPSGNKIDSATDYCEMLAPRQTWNFRAKVHDSRAVKAKLAGIREDR